MKTWLQILIHCIITCSMAVDFIHQHCLRKKSQSGWVWMKKQLRNSTFQSLSNRLLNSDTTMPHSICIFNIWKSGRTFRPIRAILLDFDCSIHFILHKSACPNSRLGILAIFAVKLRIVENFISFYLPFPPLTDDLWNVLQWNCKLQQFQTQIDWIAHWFKSQCNMVEDISNVRM